MANINQFIPFILKWEGGFINDPLDAGGATNMGVTLKTWQNTGYDKNNDGVIDEEDLKLIFRQDLVESVLRPHYWDRWQADKIRNQSIAHILVDWLWMSGMVGIKIPQRILNVKADGIVGEATLAAINNHPSQQALFEQIKLARKKYIEKICRERPANKCFKKGWLKRLEDIRFAALALLLVLCSCFTGCRSMAPATSYQSSSEAVMDSKEESLQISGNQQYYENSTQSELQTKENTVEETIVIKFDTSMPKDSSTGNHPLKEIIMKNLTMGMESLSTTSGAGQGTQFQSSGKLVEKQLQIAGEETTESQVRPNKSNKKYLSIAAISILINCIFLYRFLCKKR